MRRILMVLLLLMLALPARFAWAHDLLLFGYLSVDERGEVTVRIVDIYQSPVEGQQVLAFATPEGGRPTRSQPLAETAPGVYRGLVTPPGTARYLVTVDLRLGGDLHRVTHQVEVGKGQAEQMLPMAGIDEPGRLNWRRLLFYGAALVLMAGTVVALLRKRPVAEGE